MGSRLPSVGEASRSIRHGHVSVKDTHASLARAGLANSLRACGSPPVSRLSAARAVPGAARVGHRRGRRSRHITGEGHGYALHHAALASRVWCGRRHTLRRLVDDSRAKASRVGTPAHAPSAHPSAQRVFVLCRSEHDMEHTTADGPATMSLCDDQHVPWSPAQLLVVVHSLGGGHRARRRGAFPGQEACGGLTTTHRERGVV
jgi:hypothetical protein